ncbi:hypothetical protein CTA2_7141 [Colletotrichum tanaceti]|uniref:Uncharacterized protein n=1 Tax=Colletotrichum tanaceti TaxID=1306861 RepID=A0A4U6XVN0_9PEZI|nr:hypothetical protein CTA2_7141 [Colletotrichum tanaceti]TKW60008.1 hypothetical protein CTA1_9891 [Colletotrichum tanaceti]
MPAARNTPDQAPLKLEEGQPSHTNSSRDVDDGKRRKTVDNRYPDTIHRSSMKFPNIVAPSVNNSVRQSQLPIAMNNPGPHEPNDDKTGHHRPVTFGQSRYDNHDRLDYGDEAYGVSDRPGNSKPDICLLSSPNERPHAGYSSHRPRSHCSDRFDTHGNDHYGQPTYPRQIPDGNAPQSFFGLGRDPTQVEGMRPSETAGKPNGSRLHDIDYRRNGPPFEGKVKMKKEEAALHEITTIESLERDRFHEDNICNQCGHFDHWLGDCVFPDDGGFIMGCPIHNAKSHTWDDCPDAKKMSLERKIMYLIVRRRNKPAIRSTQPWIALVKLALQQGLEEHCWGPSVWTQDFVMKMVWGPKAGHPWLNFVYGRQLISSLPKDPETMEDPGVLVEKRSLWGQVHKPNSKRGGFGYSLWPAN